MTDPSGRFEEIIKRTRISFVADTNAKMEQVQLLFRQWADGSASTDLLVDTTHQHVHGMNGLALTLNYPLMHQACEPILSILQHHDHNWTKSDINSLQSLVERLQERIDESFAAGE